MEGNESSIVAIEGCFDNDLHCHFVVVFLMTTEFMDKKSFQC